VEEERGGPVGPHRDLEVIRVEAGMATVRFCSLIGMPERTWRRHQSRARADRATKGRWPRPVRAWVRDAARRHALAHPAWGHRKVWAMVRHGRARRVPGHDPAAAARRGPDPSGHLPARTPPARCPQEGRVRDGADRPDTCVWQLDNSRVRDHQWWDLAPGRLPGLLVEVHPPVPHLTDREHPRRVSTRSSSP